MVGVPILAESPQLGWVVQDRLWNSWNQILEVHNAEVAVIGFGFDLRAVALRGADGIDGLAAPT